MSKSFSALYASQTVAGYYTANSTTYRNPHEPGIRKCLGKTLDRLLELEGASGLLDEDADGKIFSVLDLAAGGGEASLVAAGWAKSRLGEARVAVLGADPFTKELFEKRTGWGCEGFGFREVMEGRLMDGLEASLVLPREQAQEQEQEQIPEVPGDAKVTTAAKESQASGPPMADESAEDSVPSSTDTAPATESTPPPLPTTPITTFTLTLLSFSLHLISPTELHQTLNMASLSSRYLIVLAPNRNHLQKVTSDMGWEIVPVGESEEEPWCWVREKRDERVGAGVWRSCALG